MKNRQRGRNGGKPRPMGGGGGGGGRNPNFDGNAGRPRGNAQQLMEKFLAMARDASSAGDRVLAENYFQHADHYYRVLNARFEQQNGQGGQHQQGQHNIGQGQGQRPQGNDDNRGNQMDRQDDYNQNRRYDNSPGNYGQEAQAPQPAPQAQSAPPQPQPQSQPQPQPPRQPEADIGLPPGILGIAPAVPAAADGSEESEDRTRPPQGTRRRRGGRSTADAGE